MNIFSRIKLSLKTRKVNKQIENVKEFEEQYESIASGIKVVEIPSLKFKSDNLGIDLKNTIKDYKTDKNLSSKQIDDRLNQIMNTATKYRDILSRGSTLEDNRAILTANMLINVRESERYKGMITSAVKNNDIETEGEMFFGVVREAYEKTRNINKDLFINELNTLLKQNGYEQINKTMLIKALRRG